MSKRVYISADYAQYDGDQDVVEVLNQWGRDDKHKTDFIDTARVCSGSVSDNPDCRPCDLKAEFNRQINASSAVIIVVGDKTAIRTAGSTCKRRETARMLCSCTPYKQNANGTQICKVTSTKLPGPSDDVGNINNYSYLKHEFKQASKRGKDIIVVYNSLYKQPAWLPDYLSDYEFAAEPFWIKNEQGEKVGNYPYIKQELGYE